MYKFQVFQFVSYKGLKWYKFTEVLQPLVYLISLVYHIMFAADACINGSSYYEGVSIPPIGGSPSPPPPPPPQPKDDLLELLIQLGLEKYITVFQEQEVHSHKHSHTHAQIVSLLHLCVGYIIRSFRCVLLLKWINGAEFSERI